MLLKYVRAFEGTLENIHKNYIHRVMSVLIKHVFTQYKLYEIFIKQFNATLFIVTVNLLVDLVTK